MSMRDRRQYDAAKVVLISGASSGIGKVTAEHLARKGYRVFAGLRRPGSATFGDGIDTVELDVRHDDSAAAAVNSILARESRIDVLVNNAGISMRGPIEETTIEQARALFETNVLGTLRLSRMVLPIMRHQGWGRIVNISSLAGFLPAPYLGLYSATKHAIEGLSETLDHEVRSFGIRVVVVQPSYVRTNLSESAMRTELPLIEYAGQRERVINHISAQIAKAPDSTHVARAIEQAIEAKRFQRLTVGYQAALSSHIRRWMPTGLTDELVRRGFKLDR